MFSLSELVPAIIDDAERAMYSVKADIQKKEALFEDGKVFPHIKEVREFVDVLEVVLGNTDVFEDKIEQHLDLKGINFEEGTLEHESYDIADIELVMNFLGGMLDDLLDLKGTAEQSFKKAHHSFDVEIRGLSTSKTSEGVVYYDRDLLSSASGHRVYKFSKEDFYLKKEDDDRFHILRLNDLQEVHESRPPDKIREQLLEDDLMEPGEILVSVLSKNKGVRRFPFKETVKPISKRVINEKITKLENEYGQ